MESKNERPCCCCAPYPVIDLGTGYEKSRESGKPSSEENESLKKRVMDACTKYGCFHVKINHAALGEKSSFTKSSIEMLFEESCISPQVKRDMMPASFQSRDGRIKSAKYRGREAESGGTSGLEPKQSWEYFRCHNMIQSEKEGVERMDRLTVLEDVTKIFHKVAISFFSLLDLPRGIFIDENQCKCDTQESKCYCSIDLLRAFKYDALTDEHETNLGSSPHTDWGALTVVWSSQEGLQIYCHEHKRWNTVELQEDDEEDEYVRLFIHVGDFTSLSMCTSGTKFSSPLHRVLCPNKRTDSHGTTVDESRYSLVYFAYPPTGVSLEDGRLSLPSKYAPDKKATNKFHYDRFMVLKNQSLAASSSQSEEGVYRQIQNLPFNEVIEQKWKQVQR